MPIRPIVDILPQDAAAVKRKVEQNQQPPRAYQKNVSNTTHGVSRKKGCDDLNGNGQGRKVRQDHA